jgi:hypothetical protein
MNIAKRSIIYANRNLFYTLRKSFIWLILGVIVLGIADTYSKRFFVYMDILISGPIYEYFYPHSMERDKSNKTATFFFAINKLRKDCMPLRIVMRGIKQDGTETVSVVYTYRSGLDLWRRPVGRQIIGPLIVRDVPDDIASYQVIVYAECKNAYVHRFESAPFAVSDQ